MKEPKELSEYLEVKSLIMELISNLWLRKSELTRREMVMYQAIWMAY